MQKKIIITVLTLLLIIILTLTVHVSIVNASVVTLTMDTLPENEGWTVIKYGNVDSV